MKRNNTIVNKVTKYLRHEITYNNLKPEMHLKESDIAERFGISRVPVREAFRILQSEGYIEVKPNRGSFVSKISFEYNVEIGMVYEIIVPVVLKEAIPNYKSSTYKKAFAILDKIEKSKDFSQIGYLIWDFARVIYTPSRLAFMIKILDEIYKHSIRILNEFFDDPKEVSFKVTTHRLFLNLCKEGKTEEAIDLWTDYLDKIQAMILEKLNSRTSTTGQ